MEQVIVSKANTPSPDKLSLPTNESLDLSVRSQQDSKMTTSSSTSSIATPFLKKRGFDIASLVDPENSHQPSTSSKKKKTSNSSSPSPSPSNGFNFVLPAHYSKLQGLAAQLAIHSIPSAHSGHHSSRLLGNSHPTSASSSSTNSPLTNNHYSSSSSHFGNGNHSNSTFQPSAFKKVDKHHNRNPPSSSPSTHMTTPSTSAALASLSSSLFASPSSLPFVLSSLYMPGMRYPLSHPSVAPSSANAAFLPPPPVPLSGQYHQTSPNSKETSKQEETFPGSGRSSFSGMSSSLPSVSGPTESTSTPSGKSNIPPSLLPFLPPSLAALSFPQTNWCAKCNATFRMTSDLVYHMRSHHKPTSSLDPIKKKREDKLRCNICGESFRERHHLTRHMTSHQ